MDTSQEYVRDFKSLNYNCLYSALLGRLTLFFLQYTLHFGRDEGMNLSHLRTRKDQIEILETLPRWFAI